MGYDQWVSVPDGDDQRLLGVRSKLGAIALQQQ